MGSNFPDETLDEVARIGAANFLVLKLLCQHLRTSLLPGRSYSVLARLATDDSADQLGFIYAEFWQRMTDRCTRENVNLLCDVAAQLVTARAPLTADMICAVLGLRAGDWDFALRHLAEYLTAIEREECGVQATFYRIYHESFADFLRVKISVDRLRLSNLLADYCLGWFCLPEGYARAYALKFSLRHCEETRRPEGLDLLCDPAYQSARLSLPGEGLYGFGLSRIDSLH